MSQGSFTEDHLIEQPAVVLLRDNLGWDHANCRSKTTNSINAPLAKGFVDPGFSKREHFQE